jgi:hypothetical protein
VVITNASDPETKTDAAALIFEQEQPSQEDPLERTVMASLNTLASENEAGKNQYALNMKTEWTSLNQYQPHAQ